MKLQAQLVVFLVLCFVLQVVKILNHWNASIYFLLMSLKCWTCHSQCLLICSRSLMTVVFQSRNRRIQLNELFVIHADLFSAKQRAALSQRKFWICSLCGNFCITRVLLVSASVSQKLLVHPVGNPTSCLALAHTILLVCTSIRA